MKNLKNKQTNLTSNCASKIRFLVTTGIVMTAVQIIKISCKMSGLSKLMQLKEINKI